MSHGNHVLSTPDANGVWMCTVCAQRFISAEAEHVDGAAFATALDAIAGTMSAVLFDYTERIAERYGLRPDAVRTDDTHDCEADGHRYDGERCADCGHSPFLGN